MSGLGRKVQIDGSVLNGNFLCGKLHGWAVKDYCRRERFEGFFEHDRRDGYGDYVWRDGARFVGHWKGDLAHGVGLMMRSPATQARNVLFSQGLVFSGFIAKGLY